jgi:PBS lyase HEAT-like repeat
VRATWLILVLPLPTHAGPKPGAEGTPEYQAAQELVRLLGDAKFAVREAAAKKLVDLGAAAVPALAAGTKSADEEVRTRSAALLPRAEAVGWGRRADAFLANPAASRDLPLLADWEKLAGKPDAGTRRLYADMLRGGGSVLEAVAADRTAGRTALTVRARALLATNRAKGTQVEIPAGAVAAVLFAQAVLRDPTPDPPADGSRHEPLYLLANPAVSAALGDEVVGPAFRRLAVAWVESRPAAEHMSALYFALLAHRRPFPEADPILVRLATKHRSVQIRWVALEALGQSGTAAARAKLTELLDDKSAMYDNLGNEGAGHEVRDCALAALARGAGKDPADYGLTSYMSASFWFGGTADTVTLHLRGFKSSTDRDQGLRKWKADAGAKK